MWWRVVVVVAAMGSAGCASGPTSRRVVEGVLPPIQVRGAPAEPLRSYVMSGRGEREPVPAQLDRALVEDTARVVVRSDERTCVEIMLHTEAVFDGPMQSWRPTCEIDGARHVASVHHERALPASYWYEIPVNVFWKKDAVLEVMSRTAVLCCEAPTSQNLELSLTNDLFETQRDVPWKLMFRWSEGGG